MLFFASVTIFIYSVLNNAMNRKIHKASIKSLIFCFHICFCDDSLWEFGYSQWCKVERSLFPCSDVRIDLRSGKLIHMSSDTHPCVVSPSILGECVVLKFSSFE